MLYTKYRPQNFKQLEGQETISLILKNSILNNKFSHAYLFTGVRGTGKTTTARLLAKALNCAKFQELEDVCTNCNSCKSIENGNFLDLIEIDAASNRGIDQIRELKEKINFSPSIGKYKVYIIDEVHMLTTEAFNALLKTLEEPPKHAVFILATTEINKVPLTVISRCQKMDFSLASKENLLIRLNSICKTENLNIDPDALEIIAQKAKGSYRDALSLLQAIFHIKSEQNQTNISKTQVQDILGIPQDQLLQNFLNSIAKIYISKNSQTTNNQTSNNENEHENIQTLYDTINQLINKGISLEQFINQLIFELQNILFLKNTNKEIPKDFIEWQNISTNKIINLINDLLITYQQQKDPILITLPLEIVIGKVLDNTEVNNVNINYKTANKNENQSKTETKTKTESENKNENRIKIETAKADNETTNNNLDESSSLLSKIKNDWTSLVNEIRKQNNLIASFLAESKIISVNTKTENKEEVWIIDINVNYKFHQEQLLKDVVKNLIKECSQTIWQKTIYINPILNEAKPKTNEDKKDLGSLISDVFT